MNAKMVKLAHVANLLCKDCPFVLFAWFSILENNDRKNGQSNLNLSVYISADAGFLVSIERIFRVFKASFPDSACDVTLLNHADAATRYKAVHGACMFSRAGCASEYRQFVRQAHLDYRILRAHQRRRGLIEND
ncbi:MAG: hypothetical protein ACOYNC_05960 [Bacteroidales bacterium]